MKLKILMIYLTQKVYVSISLPFCFSELPGNTLVLLSNFPLRLEFCFALIVILLKRKLSGLCILTTVTKCSKEGTKDPETSNKNHGSVFLLKKMKSAF